MGKCTEIQIFSLFANFVICFVKLMLHYIYSHLIWVRNATPTTNGLGYPNSSHVLNAA